MSSCHARGGARPELVTTDMQYCIDTESFPPEKKKNTQAQEERANSKQEAGWIQTHNFVLWGRPA